MKLHNFSEIDKAKRPIAPPEINSKIVNVLNKIEEHGFEAYIVGGFVRDYILGTESTDIDICTNALPKDIIKIFRGTICALTIDKLLLP